MKKISYLMILLVFTLVSCRQNSTEKSNNHSNHMNHDNTMMNDDSTMLHDNSHNMNNGNMMMDNDTTTIHNKINTMENHEEMYACSMHPEVIGKKNEKCSKCGMKLTVLVPEKSK